VKKFPGASARTDIPTLDSVAKVRKKRAHKKVTVTAAAADAED
jgi:hypothetical protein